MYNAENSPLFFQKMWKLLQTRFGSAHKRGEECFSRKKEHKIIFHDVQTKVFSIFSRLAQ